MKNEIHPFNVDMTISEALRLRIVNIGDKRIPNNTIIDDRITEDWSITEILNARESLCMTTTNRFRVFDNDIIKIGILVVTHDEVKSLKFIEQTKLFKDGK